MLRAGEIANLIVAIVVRRGRTLIDTEPSTIICEQRGRTSLTTVACRVIGIPSRQTFISTAVSSIVPVQIGR